MRRTQKNILAVILLVVSLTTLNCTVKSPETSTETNKQCQWNLKSLSIIVEAYIDEHNGKYPKTLDDALSNVGVQDIGKAAEMYRCPGAINDNNSKHDFASRAGYYYKNWSEWFGETNIVPNTYPVIYDSQFINHNHKGINIVLVRGKVLWDEKGLWLKNFAKEHPEYGLALPK